MKIVINSLVDDRTLNFCRREVIKLQQVYTDASSEERPLKEGIFIYVKDLAYSAVNDDALRYIRLMGAASAPVVGDPDMEGLHKWAPAVADFSNKIYGRPMGTPIAENGAHYQGKRIPVTAIPEGFTPDRAADMRFRGSRGAGPAHDSKDRSPFDWKNLE